MSDPLTRSELLAAAAIVQAQADRLPHSKERWTYLADRLTDAARTMPAPHQEDQP